MRPSVRRRLWDLVMLVAAVGLTYSAYEDIEIQGWGLGLPMVLVAGLLGYFALELLYPLWFGGPGRR